MARIKAYDVYFAEAKIGRTGNIDLVAAVNQARGMACQHFVNTFRYMHPRLKVEGFTARCGDVMDLIESRFGSVGFFAEIGASGDAIHVALRFDTMATKSLFNHGYWSDAQVHREYA